MDKLESLFGKSLEEERIPYFTLEGYESLCLVNKVYSGNTCQIVFEFLGKLYKLNVILKGIKAPRKYSRLPKEVEDSRLSKDDLWYYTGQSNKICKVKFSGFLYNKNRYLVELYDESGQSLANIMTTKSYCWPILSNFKKE